MPNYSPTCRTSSCPLFIPDYPVSFDVIPFRKTHPNTLSILFMVLYTPYVVQMQALYPLSNNYASLSLWTIKAPWQTNMSIGGFHLPRARRFRFQFLIASKTCCRKNTPHRLHIHTLRADVLSISGKPLGFWIKGADYIVRYKKRCVHIRISRVVSSFF